MSRHRICLAVSALALLGGCVTEKAPAARGTKVEAATRVATPGKPAANMPTGPIASPARAQTTVSRVQVTVAPIGTVEYDGMQLPLISPDGTRLVSAMGATPAWELLLGETGAPILSGARLVAYSVARTGLKMIEWEQTPPDGCILGRSANDLGFLIEWPREDGQRWIGLANWTTGQVNWLAQGPWVNAHGVITSRGELAYVRRAVDSERWSLVLRTREGVEIVRDGQDGDYLAVLPHPSPDVLYALRSGKSGLDVEAIRVRGAGSASSGFGTTLSRQNLTGSGTPASAYQLMMTVAPQPAPLEGESTDVLPLAILSTRVQAACVFDVDQNRLVPLLPQSLAAAPVRNGNIRGYFAATDRHLFFVPWTEGEKPVARNDARVLSSPYMARPVRSEREGPAAGLARFILLGPVKGQPDRIEVTMMVPLGG